MQEEEVGRGGGILSTCLLRSNEIMRPKKRSLVVVFYGYGFTAAVMLDRQQVSRWLIHDAGGVLANLTKINHTFAITAQTVCRRFAPEIQLLMLPRRLFTIGCCWSLVSGSPGSTQTSSWALTQS